MSYSSLHRQQADPAFTDRVSAAVMEEAWENPNVADSHYADLVRQGPGNTVTMFWPVSIATNEAYSYAVDAGNENPGGDPSVVTDGDILAAVQANWPDDPAAP